MKKLMISLVVMSFVCVGVAQAQLGPIDVDNHSFEDSTPPGKTRGWNGDMDPFDIPGWVGENGCNESGIEDPFNPKGDPGNTDYAGTDGLYAGFLGHVDPGAWNLTDHAIAGGEIFRLTLDASNTWTSTNRDPLLEVTLYYDDGNGTRNVGNFEVLTLSSTGGNIQWATYSIDFDSSSVTIPAGSKIGIELANVTPIYGGDPSWGASWMIIDDVRLDIIPEPATMMLLGLGSLVLLKRRRA